MFTSHNTSYWITTIAHIANAVHLQFDKCIMGRLKEKTVVLATNYLPALPHTEKILVMKSGTIAEQGSYNELLGKGTDFASLIENHTIKVR